MKLIDLTKIYVYKPSKKLIKGEFETKWFYKGETFLNVQQDVNELNRNSAGEIDYEIVKLRIDKKVNINKGDGISFNPLEVNETLEVINGVPDYIVKNKPVIGKTTLYTLVINSEQDD